MQAVDLEQPAACREDGGRVANQRATSENFFRPGSARSNAESDAHSVHIDAGRPGNGPGVHPTPDAPDFDPWCISDPVATGNEHDDPAARSALEHLWRNDPDPAATIALFEAVEHEAANGSVVHEPEAGYYYCTPWPSIYTVVRPVTLAGHALTPGQQFTLDICTGDHAGGDSSFRRDLLIQSFSPTSRLGYCDQEASGPRGSC